jgi:hypothetical protein
VVPIVTVAKHRTNWSSARIADLTDMYLAGMLYDDMATQLRISNTSIKFAVDRFCDLTPELEMRRRESMVAIRWGKSHPGNIAQSLRCSKELVVEIAERLGLDTENPVKPTFRPRGRYPWDNSEIKWACANRKTDRQASLIWDVLRVAERRKPIGKGYAA